jgi:ABC-type nitrate/sulfonate/bicarbonate transport system substrate-binding protein
MPKGRCVSLAAHVRSAVLFLSTVLPVVGFAQEAKTKIRISYPTASICCIALFAAQQWKIFEENGLEVESIQMRSQAANAALVSGDIHYVAGVGPSSVTATLRGLPSKAVWFASDRLIYSLMARPEIKTLKELRGKRIGVTGFGGTAEVALKISLEAMGENPKDFILVPLAGAQYVPALEAGTIDAAQLNPPLIYYAKRKGFRELLDAGPYVRMPLGGVTASQAAIQNRAAELKRVLKSLQLAKRMSLEAKDKTVDLMVRILKVDRQTAEEAFGDYRKTISVTGVPAREGIEQIIKSVQSLGQFTGRKIAFEEVADDRIAKEVAKELGY